MASSSAPVQGAPLQAKGRAEIMLPPPSPAEVQRRDIWAMPKNMLPLCTKEQVRYVNQDGNAEIRDLVVLKGSGTRALVERSAKVIAHGTPAASRLLLMYREGHGKNWARDVPSQRNRDGWRAFRMRSGMRDQRYDPKYRTEQKRLPDHQRKRIRWGQFFKTGYKWRGMNKKPKRVTTSKPRF